ncbi:SHOCT domain-containing protein [Marinimicrobium locisalis]|uniref:SHOCT domain-containing protein n=1 Tax=Marinimicrobium locisalis TaxID=546022 RepID=UPI0032217C85
MDSTIIAALISAAASIVAAIIGNARSSGAEKGHPNLLIPRRNQRMWIIAVSVLLGWLIFAALFLHWDLAGMSVLAIPVVMWTFAAAFPIRPSIAVAAVLFLFPLAFTAEPIGKWRRGMSFDNHFDAGVVGTFVGIAFGTALITWIIAWWRSKSLPRETRDEQLAPNSGTLAKDLSELSALHKAGALTEEEFVRAKEKLLSKH